MLEKCEKYATMTTMGHGENTAHKSIIWPMTHEEFVSHDPWTVQCCTNHDPWTTKCCTVCGSWGKYSLQKHCITHHP